MALSLLFICNGSLVIAYCAAQGRRGPVPLLSRRLLTTVGGANATSWDRWPPVAPGSKMLCVTFSNTSHSQIPFRREVRQQSCSKWWHSSVELRSQPAAHVLAEGPQWASRRGFTLRHGSKQCSGLCQLGHWIRLGTVRVCRKHRIQCCISKVMANAPVGILCRRMQAWKGSPSNGKIRRDGDELSSGKEQ